MDLSKRDMIANIVKEKRKEKGYTQKELADRSKISLRSIQRIENGEVIPRMYTLKTLASCLNFPLDLLNEKGDGYQIQVNENKEVKIILSIAIGFLIFLLATAYIAQSGSFPETGFEFLIYCACMVILYTLILLKIWHKRA